MVMTGDVARVIHHRPGRSHMTRIERRDDADVPIPLEAPVSTRPRAPRITAMSQAACEAILERNHVGRLAYSFRDRVNIVPLHYVYRDGWIYGRTSIGEKVAKLRHNRWVAFEVDEIEDWFEWRSVVARGALYLLHPDETPDDVWGETVNVLTKAMPGIFTARDPVPSRTELFRISVDELTGRRATSKPGRVQRQD
jgi:nitroimidazol reductase NimA-like FMN-containing flavoprotein (pyridoxamine 5'-phosphate oxidase superfamily)